MHSHLCQCASRTRPFPFSSTPKLCSNSNTLSTTIFFSSTFAFSSSLRLPHFRALRTSNGGKLGSHDANDPALLRKPSISEPSPSLSSSPSMEIVESSEAVKEQQQQRSDSEWVDWEDQILEDTVPLVGFVRMILHSGKYESGDRLSQEHEKTILERLLPYHPEYEKKIGCGIDFITIGYHPDFENSRCLFIARKDGELVDFSYWKCIKGLIRKNYPLYADSFILRHFRRRKRAE